MTSPNPSLLEQVFADANTRPPEQDSPSIEAMALALCVYARHRQAAGVADAQDAACADCRMQARVALAALRRHAHAVDERFDDIGATARLLAEHSGHARYSANGLGYMALLGAPVNIEHAHKEAKVRLAMTAAQDPDLARLLDDARDVLLAHAEQPAVREEPR